MADKPTVDGFYPRRPNTRGDNISSGGGMGFNEPQSPHYRAPSKGPQVLRASNQPPQRTVQQKDTYRMPGEPTAPHGVAPNYQSAPTRLDTPPFLPTVKPLILVMMSFSLMPAFSAGLPLTTGGVFSVYT